MGGLLKSLFENRLFSALVGGLLFVSVFQYFGYGTIDRILYFCRDDGIITLSHARNLIDYGFIGVNPSGERIEAFSSPLQFVAYLVPYLLFKIDPFTYTEWQTVICSFIIGAMFIQFFHGKNIFKYVVCFAAALCLTRLYPFLSWHGSGMENALSHASFLVTLYIFYKFIREEKIIYWLSTIVFLSTISRIESIVHIVPLLFVFSILWYVIFKRTDALIFSGIVLGLCVLFHLSRLLYFGDIMSNTVYAQGISIWDRILRLLHFDQAFINENITLCSTIFSRNGGLILVSFLPLFSLIRFDKKKLIVLALLICSIITLTLNPILFGLTRIDVPRTTTQLALVVVLFCSILLYYLEYNSRRLILLLILMTPLLFVVYSASEIKPYYLGFDTGGFEKNERSFMKLAKENNILRPTVANPDLGIVSWCKEMNIIDLGMLGNPILAHVKSSVGRVEYVLEYALPDMIESHGSWSQDYSAVFCNEKFKNEYEHIINWGNYRDSSMYPQGFWIRKDIEQTSTSRERCFLDLIQDQIGNIDVPAIEREIQYAIANKIPSGYISRTVYRYLPEIRKQGKYGQVDKLFQSDQLTEYDRYLIESATDARKYRGIVDILNQAQN